MLSLPAGDSHIRSAGAAASSQITPHSSQYSLCSFLSVYAGVRTGSYHMVQEVGFHVISHILIFYIL